MNLYQSWHSHGLEKVLKNLKTTKHDLSSRLAKRRLAKNGPNSLPQERKLSKLLLFLKQLNSPLQKILGTVGLGKFDWLMIVAITIFELMMIDAFKMRIFLKKQSC